MVDLKDPDLDAQLRLVLAGAGLEPVTVPAQDPARVSLGQALMFDRLLSGNRDIACATCHHPRHQTGDGLSLSIGTGGAGLGPGRALGAGKPFIPRNANPVFNLGAAEVMFWDGRVRGNPTQGLETPAGAQLPAGLTSALAAQAMFPVTSRDEMRGQAGDLAVDGSANELAALSDDDLVGIWDALAARLRANPEYVRLFQAAYPDLQPAQIGFQHAANAIAAFEIDQLTRLDSPFDRYLAGENGALSVAQKRGALLFYGRARCAECHRGGLFSDFEFHNVGAPQVGPGKGADAPLDLGLAGRTGAAADRFRFRTAPLRNVALTGPWMHSGGYTTLAAAVRHFGDPARRIQDYDREQLGPRLQGQVHNDEAVAAGLLANLDPILAQPSPLSEAEVEDVVAFLESLSDPRGPPEAPPAVPSGLPVD
ncbi:MAG: hypothetical protein AMXMBFR33_32310 [Candidatus Xenobia bacterium]